MTRTFSSILFAARDVVVALRFERLIDRLERARAITPAQRVRLDETLLSYDKARKQQIDADAGNDPTRAAILNLRQTFADATREVFESLDRQMDDFIENYEATRGTLHLTDNQRATLDRDHALFVMGSPGKPSAERMVVLRKVFIDGFDLELQRAALTARLAGRAPQTGK